MKVTPTTFTVAEYCDQMRRGDIVVNRDYQRSPKVWPPAARSYLIDTVLLGYPMPKLSLYSKTDLRTKRTIKEIVDGQQRSQTILAFANDDLRISGQSTYAGKKFSQLEETQQQQFLEYPIMVDLLVAATEKEIREQFRRINSYNVPLNPQEKRHAVYQGDFKWFIVELTNKYAQVLKDIGIFTESQLSRMNDAVLLLEIVLAITEGIQSASERKNDALYRDKDRAFPEKHELEERIDAIFDTVLDWQEIHRTDLLKSYNFYSLSLAITHTKKPVLHFEHLWPRGEIREIPRDVVLSNLGVLSETLENPGEDDRFREFVEACSKATNRLIQRETRFQWFCQALNQIALP